MPVCKEVHLDSDKPCDSYKVEKEILTFKEKQLSHAEARRMTCQNNIHPGKSYARITKSAVQQKKCLNVEIPRTPEGQLEFPQASEGRIHFAKILLHQLRSKYRHQNKEFLKPGNLKNKENLELWRDNLRVV